MATATMKRATSAPGKKSVDTRAARALQITRKLAKTGTWQEVYNKLYSGQGELSRLFPDEADRVAFQKTSQAELIRTILSDLRRQDHSVAPAEPGDKFLLRMPKSMKAALQAESEAEGVSLNQLILLKIAASLGKVLGRK